MFTVRMTDGTEIPETGGTRQVTTLGGEFTTSSGEDLIFDVPANFTLGDFVMRLGAATATAEFSDGRLPVSWQPDPQPFAMAIDLTK